MLQEWGLKDTPKWIEHSGREPKEDANKLWKKRHKIKGKKN